MPSYEYRCPICNADKIVVRGIIESEVIPKCDNCKVDCIRIFRGPVVTFNGSGFYATDKKEK